MSIAAEEGVVEQPNGGERPLLVRAFGVQAQLVDDRTIDVRVVPFNEIATVSDPPDHKPYREQFMPGVFANQERAANRVLLRTEHSINLMTGEPKPQGESTGVVGHGLSLESAANDGYHGRFKFHDGEAADLARTLVREGVFEGVSAEFVPLRSIRTREGVVQRHKAHLDSVTLARSPAYSTASILAMREEAVIDEDMIPPSLSPEFLQRCEDLGIVIPERMIGTLARAYSEAAWDGSASRWSTAAAYCSACAIDVNPAGKTKTKMLCHLPYKEPGSGDINLNAVRAALARIGQGDPKNVSQSVRDEARTLLEGILAKANQAKGRAAAVAKPGPDSPAIAGYLLAALRELERAANAEIDATDKAAIQQMVKTCRGILAAQKQP